jgi:hypothetical protein
MLCVIQQLSVILSHVTQNLTAFSFVGIIHKTTAMYRYRGVNGSLFIIVDDVRGRNEISFLITSRCFGKHCYPKHIVTQCSHVDMHRFYS